MSDWCPRCGDNLCKGDCGSQDGVMLSVPITVAFRTREALVDARDNANELLTDHLGKHGRTTNKNHHIAKMYEKELDRLEGLIEFYNQRMPEH